MIYDPNKHEIQNVNNTYLKVSGMLGNISYEKKHHICTFLCSAFLSIYILWVYIRKRLHKQIKNNDTVVSRINPTSLLHSIKQSRSVFPYVPMYG